MRQEFSEEQIEEDIKGLVAGILEVEPEEIKSKDHFVKDLGMDSMMALEILAGIEKKYRIAIPEENLPEFTNLDRTTHIVVDILKQKS